MRIQTRQGNRHKFPTSKTKIRKNSYPKITDNDKSPGNQGKVATIVYEVETSEKKSRRNNVLAKSTQGQSSNQGQIVELGSKSSPLQLTCTSQHEGTVSDFQLDCREKERRDLVKGERQAVGEGLEETGSGSGILRITTEDLKLNFFIGRVNSLLNVWPLSIDKDTGKLKLGGSAWINQLIYKTWLIFIKIHLLQGTVQTLYLILKMGEGWEKEILRIALIVMLLAACFCLRDSFSHIISEQLDTLLVVNNAIVEESKNEPVMDSRGTCKSTVISLIRSILRRRFRQNFLIYLPLLVYPLAFLVPILEVADPSNPVLFGSLYYLVQQGVETYWTSIPTTIGLVFYVFLVLCDFLMINFYVFIIDFGVYVILLFTHKTAETEEMAIQQLENYAQSGFGRAQGIEKACSTLHYLHLLIHMFNESFSRAVYNTKITALLASIFGGFGAILALRLDQYAFVGLFGMCFIEGIVIYNMLFGLAYRLTDGAEEIKLAILTESAQLTGDKLVRVRHSRFVRAIPVLGIKDGSFGLMDRLVTFTFTDFVFSQIVDLVITFI